MKVICSGMSKTGTKTLASALRILGYKVYDFEEQYFHLGEDLVKILREGWCTEDIRRIFKDVDAVTDTPGNMLWEELLEAFPDAKVVHTERASEEKWVESAMGQMSSMQRNIVGRILVNFSPTGKKLAQFLGTADMIALIYNAPQYLGSPKPSKPHKCIQFHYWEAGYGLIQRHSYNMRLSVSALPNGLMYLPVLNQQIALLRYRQHNTRVKAVVPKEKLLVLNFSDGWKPLCEFLSKPIPTPDFPHRNKGGSITQEVVDHSYIFKPIKNELRMIVIAIVVLISLLVGYCFY